MHVMSVPVPDKIFLATQSNCEILHISETEYVCRALSEMNRKFGEPERKQALQQASLRVRAESLRVNAEFSDIEHDPNA